MVLTQCCFRAKCGLLALDASWIGVGPPMCLLIPAKWSLSGCPSKKVLLPKEQTGKFDHKNYIPDVFVINLGTNDMRKTHTTPLSKENYIRDYNQFIKKLRSYAPKSKIILCIGPMGFMPVKPWLSEIPKQHKNTSVLIFDAYKDASEKGGHFHPSIKKDKLMATQLQKAISKLTKWK